MTFGSSSFSHQQVYDDGRTSFGRLHPGHLHCFGIGSAPSSLGCCCKAEPSFLDHFLMQPIWKTVQHVRQDHIFEFRLISLVHIAHSYTPFPMSSCVRVEISGAVDLSREPRLLV